MQRKILMSGSSGQKLVRGVLFVVCGTLIGSCGGMRHATPVVPVPATPEEEQALRSALVGEWHWRRTIEADGRERDEHATTAFTFDGAGHLRYRFGRMDMTYDYAVEGRNVRTSHPGFAALRIDSVSPDEIRAFWYDLSVTLVLVRQG